MADPRIQVDLSASFLERLESVEAFLAEARTPQAYAKLLDGLRRTVIPNLSRFPRIGRRYLDQPPQSAEAMTQLAALPPGAADALREYLHDDYLLLYALTDSTVFLLSIRHHRQLSVRFREIVGTFEAAMHKRQLTRRESGEHRDAKRRLGCSVKPLGRPVKAAT